MSLSELPNELAERGIWWQVGGFTIAGCASVAVLQIWEGSDYWAFRSFEIAVKRLYWMFVLPLAGLFEGARKLFEKASEIRAAQRAKIREKAHQQGLREGRQEGREQGRKQGLEEGRTETIAEIRARLLAAASELRRQDTGTEAITLTPELIDSILDGPAESQG